MQNAAEFVMDTLNGVGFEAFLVGGCVRDMVLGRTPKDFDVTTNATPEEVVTLFNSDKLVELFNCHTIPVGAKFGVVVVMVNGHQIEVATFRADGAYSDGRRPDEVHYSDNVKDDVMRRDFTINGLVADFAGEDGTGANRPGFEGIGSTPLFLKDFVGGLDDIKAKLIRCIGDPNKRFEEDALRMLRAVRFVAQLGFTIEQGTFDAIQANADSITSVSRERVREELCKLVTGKFAVQGLAMFAATGLFSRLFDASFVADHSMALTLERFAKFPTTDPLLGLAMLLTTHDFHNNGVEAVRSLKLSNDEQSIIIGALAHKMNVPLAQTDAEIKRLAREPGTANAVTLFEQDLALGGTNFGVEAGMAQVLRFRALTPEDVRPTPMVTGKDLIAMGFAPGPIFTTVLNAVETKQLNGEFKSAEEALAFAKVFAEDEVKIASGEPWTGIRRG